MKREGGQGGDKCIAAADGLVRALFPGIGERIANDGGLPGFRKAVNGEAYIVIDAPDDNKFSVLESRLTLGGFYGTVQRWPKEQELCSKTPECIIK